MMGIISTKLRHSAKGKNCTFQIPGDRRFIDMTGRTFGRLTVVSYAGRPKPSLHKWVCECSCGQEIVVDGARLRSGKTSSCGCLRRELNARRFVTHDQTYSPEYNSWIGMKGRCLNAANPKFYRYGGRGISVCDQWMTSFDAFLHDMGPRPSPQHSIDRIDNNGNYEPSNCRWATPVEQQRNRGGKRAWKGAL